MHRIQLHRFQLHRIQLHRFQLRESRMHRTQLHRTQTLRIQLTRFRRAGFPFVLGLALLALAGCNPSSRQQDTASRPASSASLERTQQAEEPTRETAMRRLPWRKVPVLLDDGLQPGSESRAHLRTALQQSSRWLARRPADYELQFGPRRIEARRLAGAMDRLLTWLDQGLGAEQLAAEVMHAFDVYESVGGRDGAVLVTGYFEPEIAGSRQRSARYPIPIYRPPTDLVRVTLGDFDPEYAGVRLAGRLRNGRLEPYPDRRGIRESGLLRGRELAWARDPVDIFFLEIQGSGTLRLEGGGELRIGYAGGNGRPYRSIGRLLIEEGHIEREKVSMQSIRAWLDRNPAEVQRVLDHNQSQVFFRPLDGPPVGSLGVPVTPGRSIATDLSLFPRGALAFLVSEVPALAADGSTVAEAPLTRFVLNQDTGGAIRGPGRVDFFWGRGAEAAARAGAMKQPGRLLFLLPKEPPAAEDAAEADQRS